MKRQHSLFLILTALIFLGNPCLAEDASHHLQKLLPTQCQLMGQYIQTQKKENITKPLVSYGRFVFDCNNGLIWETQQPIKESTVHLKSHKSFQIANGKAELLKGIVFKKVGALLNQILSGEVEAIERDFHISHKGEQATLTPRRGKLKKFINNIQIDKNQEGAHIQLNYSDKEYSELSLAITEKPEHINQESCIQSQTVNSLACTTLYDQPLQNPQ